MFGVLQKFLHGRLIFNIFNIYLTSYLLWRKPILQDDNTPHVTAKNLDNVIRVTYFYGFQIIKWSCNYEYQWFWNEKHWIRKTTWDKVSCKLKFKSSLSGIIETAGNYWNALSSATKFMSVAEYCLLVRMFHWRTINKIKHLREKCLRSIYKDKTSAFKELLTRNNWVYINRKIQ